MSPRPVYFDCDTGIDDALALAYLMASPEIQLVGIGTVSGNINARQAAVNTLDLLAMGGKGDVAVAVGAMDPLTHGYSGGVPHIHGHNGVGDVELPHTDRGPEAESAADMLVRLAHAHPGELDVIAIGPLTNLALALKLDPSLPARVARLVVMGGAVNGRGNITPFAEFNTHFDPEAAHIVFEAFPAFDLADWEATVAHGFLHADVDVWCGVDSPRARFYDGISQKTRAWSGERRGDRWHSADSLAMAFALAPEAAETARHALRVALDGPGRGMTLVDWQDHRRGPANARILIRYDQAAFEARVARALAAG